MIRIILLLAAMMAVSSCAALLPRAPAAPPTGGDPFTHVETEGTARAAYKEIGIIERMDAAGCDIRRFETMTSVRRSTITVDCK